MGIVTGLRERMLDGCWALYDAFGRVLDHLLPPPRFDARDMPEFASATARFPDPSLADEMFGMDDDDPEIIGTSTLSYPAATQTSPGAISPESDEMENETWH